ncbi:restriction endonuclease subunit M [Pasteurellaceae bacterium Macca]|nr:restriction endonuclease subunit M [Pasteurellaceae bacterium Macca]
MAKTQSIEPNIADLVNGWLKSYQLDYKLEQEHLNDDIDNALSDYFSKTGGEGANRPDAKLLLRHESSQQDYPILIEYKGYKDKLAKLDSDGNVVNRNDKGEPLFKNINSFAVNGAVHYANAVLHHTHYTDIIAIGVTGHKDDLGKIHTQIGVYYVSKKNLGVGQKIGEFSDLSFLAKEHFDNFIKQVDQLTLSQEELDRLKEKREREIDISLTKLNNDIYQNEKGLGENDRVYLVAAVIMATLGENGVRPLEKSDLKSYTEKGDTDGEIIIRKINAFLDKKNLPEQKKDLIIRTLSNTLLTENINKVKDGQSQLKRVFTKIVDDLGIYYKIGLTTDFTGKLFNEMYSWLGFTQDKLNDVVLTPSYVATLLAKLARVNRNSYVWDFATGSAGLLVAAMNEMLIDAKNNITSPAELRTKELEIKSKQLLGIELLSSVYMLAILNMILMGDGSSNILNKDSLTDFNGKYGFGDVNQDFPADAFILNPPYSAAGNGMNFVEKALNMMQKGYAAIIIQNSAGTGKAKEINRRILEKHTLMASIKMPIDLFIGKSSVQTQIYVFRVNEAHQADEIVKFIDFSNDGYTRTNRKKASNNLKNTDRATERYQELVDLVRFGKSKLHIFTEQEYYEGKIDPKNGSDWNQTAPIDTKPTLQDFKKTVSDYLAWEVSQLLKQNQSDNGLGK